MELDAGPGSPRISPWLEFPSEPGSGGAGWDSRLGPTVTPSPPPSVKSQRLCSRTFSFNKLGGN